jgi:hypothetical protein
LDTKVANLFGLEKDLSDFLDFYTKKSQIQAFGKRKRLKDVLVNILQDVK